MPDFIQLTGIAVGGMSVWLMYKLLANHTFHLTKTIAALTEAIHDLRQYLKNGK